MKNCMGVVDEVLRERKEKTKKKKKKEEGELECYGVWRKW